MDNEWEKLLRKCGEPSEAEWQEYLQCQRLPAALSERAARSPAAEGDDRTARLADGYQPNRRRGPGRREAPAGPRASRSAERPSAPAARASRAKTASR